MIGILAGMGPRSTSPFIDAVIDHCQALYGAKLDEEFPRMMILSLPTPFYIDRPIDHDLMQRTIRDGLKQLESAHVDFIAMPCNSAHIYYEELADSIEVPLLHIVEEALARLNGTGRTALLGTQGTIDSGLYQAGLLKHGVDLHVQTHWQNRINRIIGWIKSGETEDKAIPAWRGLLDELQTHDVGQAIIACTDINAIADRCETPIDFVDSTKVLAKATVEKYLQVQDETKTWTSPAHALVDTATSAPAGKQMTDTGQES